MKGPRSNSKKRRHEDSRDDQESIRKKPKDEESLLKENKLPSSGDNDIRPSRGTDENGHVSVNQVAKKAEEESCVETASIKNMISLLNVQQTRSTGLQKILHLCRSEHENAVQFAKTYLKMSPECKELFQIFEGEERPTTQVARLVWEVFESLLLITSDAANSLQSSGLYITHRVLSKYLKQIYSALGSTTPAELTKSVLRLLTAILTQGKQAVTELLASFDFTLKALESVSKRRDRKAKLDVRTCYIRFFLAFLVFGDLAAVKQILELQVLSNGIFNGLSKDSAETVYLILSTLNNKVMKRPGLLKKTKIAFFTSQHMMQLAYLYALYSGEGKDGNDDVTDTQNAVCTLIMERLTTLCTDHENGIIFPLKQTGLTERSSNPVLLKFLRLLQKTAKSDMKMQHLISQTLASSHDLILPLISTLGINLEPRMSSPWLQNINFLTRIWSDLPSPRKVLQDANLPIVSSNLPIVVKLVFPSILTRTYLINGLKQCSLFVRQKTIEAILICMNRAMSVLSMKDCDARFSGDVEEQLIDLLFKQLPEAATIVAVRQSWASGSVKTSQDENEAKGGDMERNVDPEQFDALILDLMECYQRLRPGVFSSLQFNISKLFQSDKNKEEFIDSSVLRSSCQIAAMEPRGSLKWFSKKTDTYLNACQMIIDAYLMTNSTEIKLAAKSLIVKLLEETGSLDEHPREAETWLRILSLVYDETKDVNLSNVFQEICTTSAHHFYSIIDELAEIVVDVAADDESIGKKCSYNSSERLEFSPIVVAALRLFLKNLNEEGKIQTLATLTRLVTLFLMDMLLSQENPTCLLRVIEKYVRLISDHCDSQSVWINDWFALLDFGCRWSNGIGFNTKKVEKELIVDHQNRKTGHTFASMIREVFPLTSEDLEKSCLSLTDFKSKLTSSLRMELTRENMQIILNCLENVNHVSTNENSLHELRMLFGSLIKDFLTMFQEQCQSGASRSSDECEAKSDDLEHIFAMILKCPTFQKEYLVSVNKDGNFSNCLMDIFEVVLNASESSKTRDIAACYFENISKVLKESLDSWKEKKSCKKGKKILKVLKLFVKFGPLGKCLELLTDVLTALRKAISEASKSGEACKEEPYLSALQILVNTEILSYESVDVKGGRKRGAGGDQSGVMSMDESSCEDVSKGDFNENGSIGLQTHVKTDHRDNSEHDTVSITLIKKDESRDVISSESRFFFQGNIDNCLAKHLNNRHLADIFFIAAKIQNQGLEKLVVRLLQADKTCSVLASLDLLDLSVEMSKDRVDIVSCLVDGSPLHARYLLRSVKLGKKEYVNDLWKMLPVIHSFLFHQSGRIKREAVKYYQSRINDFVSLLTKPNHMDDDSVAYKKLAEILIFLCSSLKDKDEIMSSLFEMLEADPDASTKASDSLLKCQLKVFDAIVINGIMTNNHDVMAINCLQVVMRKLEHHIISQRNKSKSKKLPLQSIIDIWNSWLKTILRKRFQDTNSILSIRHLITTLYSVKKFKKNSTIDLQTIYEYILSHSLFIPTMLNAETKHNNKEAIVALLLSIAEMAPLACQQSHLKVFMASYNATMSSTDLKLLQLLKMYEEKFISVLTLRSFLWGNEGLKRLNETQDTKSTLFDSSIAKEIFELLDRNMLLKSAYNFPLSLDITAPKTNVPSRDDIYHPAFLLPVFSYILGPSIEVDCRKFIDTGCLSYAIAATTSSCIATRKAGYHILARFTNHLEASRFREKNQISILLDSFRNAITEETMQLPSISCCFLIRCLQIILRADQYFYPIINNYLLQKPCMIIKDVPLLLPMLNSSNLQYSLERAWVLKLLHSGFRTAADYYIYKRRHVFELLMTLCDSPICDKSAKKPIYDLLLATSKLHQAAFDLVKNYGLLSWLHSKLNSSDEHSIQFVVQMLSNLKDTFEQGYKPLDGDENSEVKRPKLANFPLECTLVCMTLIEMPSFANNPDHVSSIVEVIQWCSQSSSDVMHATMYMSREQLCKLIEQCNKFPAINSNLFSRVWRNCFEILHAWIEHQLKLSQENLLSNWELVCEFMNVIFATVVKVDCGGKEFDNVLLAGINIIRKLTLSFSTLNLGEILLKPSTENLFNMAIKTWVSIKRPKISTVEDVETGNKRRDNLESSLEKIESSQLVNCSVNGVYDASCSNIFKFRFHLCQILAVFICNAGKQNKDIAEDNKLIMFCNIFNSIKDKNVLLHAALKEVIKFIHGNPECDLEQVLSKNDNFFDYMELLVMEFYKGTNSLDCLELYLENVDINLKKVKKKRTRDTL
eukprot:gene250-869_t